MKNAKEALTEKMAAYPLRIRMVIGIVIAVVGSAAIAFGLDGAGVEEQISNAVLAVFDLLVLAGIVKTSEAKVTPLSNPQDNRGRHLTP